MDNINTLLEHIDKIHTTNMGFDRIRKNLQIEEADVVGYCKNKIMNDECRITRQGKNWYCEIEGIKITINANSYTIITAHKTKYIPFAGPHKTGPGEAMHHEKNIL